MPIPPILPLITAYGKYPLCRMGNQSLKLIILNQTLISFVARGLEFGVLFVAQLNPLPSYFLYWGHQKIGAHNLELWFIVVEASE